MRAMWNDRTSSWHEHVTSSPAFEQIRESAIAAAGVGSSDDVVDLGAGTGFLTLPVATSARRVIAVDLSPQMLSKLGAMARDEGLANIECVVAELERFDVPPASVDVVISCYALHHLRDEEKAALVRRSFVWLRPGGRLVIADMMFGRGGTSEDRKIVRAKVARMIKRGPAGVWRIAKNIVRFGLHRGTELPVPPPFWVDALRREHFADVQFTRLVAEAGLVVGHKPHAT